MGGIDTSKYTTIMVRREIRDKLRKLRLTRRDTYDEIIERLLKDRAKENG
jgi:predicted CopG family antitoxin